MKALAIFCIFFSVCINTQDVPPLMRSSSPEIKQHAVASVLFPGATISTQPGRPKLPKSRTISTLIPINDAEKIHALRLALEIEKRLQSKTYSSQLRLIEEVVRLTLELSKK